MPGGDGEDGASGRAARQRGGDDGAGPSQKRGRRGPSAAGAKHEPGGGCWLARLFVVQVAQSKAQLGPSACVGCCRQARNPCKLAWCCPNCCARFADHLPGPSQRRLAGAAAAAVAGGGVSGAEHVTAAQLRAVDERVSLVV